MTERGEGLRMTRLGQATRKGSPAGIRDGDFVDAAAGEVELPVRRRYHVADDAASRGNRPLLKRLRLRIEGDERVGLDAGFAVPDGSVGGGRDAVGLRAGSARRSPLLDLARLRIEPG